MKRGSITILIILLVAIGAGAVSVWYHYANQRLVQDFWGTGAAMLISQAPEVTAMRLGEPGRALSDDDAEPPAAEPVKEEADAEPPAEPRPVAVEFNQVPWLVVDSRSAARAKGVSNLRRALVLDTTYDWSVPAEKEPHWQYALDMNDGHDFAAVLFDFDTRQVALAGGRRTAVMNAEAAEEFQKFFEEQFAEEAGEGAPDKPATDESPPESAEQPAAKSDAAAVGDATEGDAPDGEATP